MPYKDRAKQRAYQNRWVQQRRSEWLAANGPCSKCGCDKDLRIASADPKNAVSHRVWSWRKEKREAVLAMCVVLCLDCLRKHHCPEGRHSRRRRRRPKRNGTRVSQGKAATPIELPAAAQRHAWFKQRARELAERWRTEITDLELPTLASELGREPVELVLAEVALGEQYMAEFLQAVPMGPSIVRLAVAVLVDQGALRQRNGKAYYLMLEGEKLRRAALVASVAVGSLWSQSYVCNEEDAQASPHCEPEEEERSVHPSTKPRLDTITRVMYRLFGYDY